MILCVTLNPLVDTSYFVDEIRPVYRTEAYRVTHVAGGKGNNAARALTRLGYRARAFTVAGSRTGQHLSDLIDADGVDKVIAWISGETRQSITVVDRAYQQRAYFAPPQVWQPDDVSIVRQQFARALDGAQAVCVCGSSPCALADELYPELVRAARARGAVTLLDSYGRALQLGLQAAPTIAKMNRHEASTWLGRPIESLADQLAVLDEMRRHGVEWAVLTLGEAGALLACDAGRWAARPPQVRALNPMGSGDAMAAVLVAGYLEGRTPLDCFRLSMAAAVANAVTWDVCYLDRRQVEAIAPQIEISPLASVTLEQEVTP